MSHPDPTAITEAISTYLSDPFTWQARTGQSDLLEQSAREIAFNRGALVPIGPLVTASLVELAAMPSAKGGSPEVLDRWNSAVLDSCEAYAREPEGWKEDDVVRFEGSIARCFGVEDDRVHELIRNFHQLPEGVRFGIFLMIEEAPAFQWMSEAIDAFDRDVSVEAPPKAFRRLIQSLQSAE